jgi:curved DNA-binding protein CbpA
LTQLFSCFKSSFVNQLYYDQMVKLFAYVITLKDDPQYQSVETQFAEKSISELSRGRYDGRSALSDEKKRYNNFRRRKALPQEMGYVNVCLSILKNKGVDYTDRMELLSHLFECAYASDGMVDDDEWFYLSQIAYYLCIKEWDLLSLKYRFETQKQAKGHRQEQENTQQRERYRSVCSSRKREAYKLLNLKENAPLEEVKSAYRTQVKTCHPDTLPPTATDSEREEAAIRFRAVTEAYDFLCAELAAEPVSVTK